ncbi:Nuclear pore glycoprotein p62 [Asimina triloba]
MWSLPHPIEQIENGPFAWVDLHGAVIAQSTIAIRNIVAPTASPASLLIGQDSYPGCYEFTCASTESAPKLSFAGTVAPTAQTSSSVSAASSTSATLSQTPKLPSEITGKTVEEIIKDWNAELQERTGKFRKQAVAIAEWDRRILQNRDILLRLESEVAKVVETQTNLERQLELIETHQQEVDKALQSAEEEAERIFKDERRLLLEDEAAATRDSMYEHAEFIEREMQQMAEQIKSIIETLNGNQGADLDMIDGMTPIDIVVRILNNQLSSLMWIDEKASATEFSSRIQKLANRGAAADRDLEMVSSSVSFRMENFSSRMASTWDF